MHPLSQSELARRRGAKRARQRRLTAIGSAVTIVLIAAAIVAAIVAGSSTTGSRPPARTSASESLAAGPPGAGVIDQRDPVRRGRIPPARPGTARVFFNGGPQPSHGPARNEVALTFDDGFCGPCVARIVHTLARTGAHATIFPNGRYSREWDPLARLIRRLVARGQLTIGNHTFLHHDAQLESAAAFQADLMADETWIERTFHVTARPFFRPPYGAYDQNTLKIARSLGYTKVIIWSGTVADSSPHTIGYILDAIRYWAHPGAIILMHGNYPATSLALPRILAILRQRGLKPVTLSQLLG
jgi:peptidoglycan/xylan/chitin deacetylase (PgdA/CDA1 family)